MVRRFYLPCFGLLAALVGGVFPAQAADAPGSQEWRVCTGDGSTSEAVIKNCSVVIQAGREPKARLAVAHYHRATAYRMEGRTDRAIQDYDQAIELDPKYAIAFNDRGTAYSQKAQPNRAIQNFDQAIRLDPQMASAFNNRGNAHTLKGDLERAIQDSDQALRLQPK